MGNGNAHKLADDTVTVNETMNNGSIPSEIHIKTESPTPYNNGHGSHEINKEEYNQGIVILCILMNCTRD